MSEKTEKDDGRKKLKEAMKIAAEVYKKDGVAALAAHIGIPIRRLRRDAEKYLAGEKKVPTSEEVFAAWDEADGDNDTRLDAVLGVMGLSRDDLAPGQSWAYRDESLTLVLADARRVTYQREDENGQE